jgi:hypothetical protein
MQALIAIVFACAALEGFINELGARRWHEASTIRIRLNAA